ncbi:MerR family transcriptional regulator [Pseudooceanicola sp.]|uniref:MerR family transcriptional regulator n=1 Tax=Pseudooceanicola sp. TaxID=1914328 RepID=UPI000C0BA9AE|nr:MerR family transcriptional regulator [Pseudooceanicola sp.]|tara:strand:+ start:192 stop:605 length:414 start_codon:yes stop_codon:yes gene_type:complete
MSDSRLTFKEMCTRFDVTPRTLRYYEYIELLTPERQGRSRFYRSRDRARMKLILRGRKYGFSLESIRQWLDIYDEQGSEAQRQLWIENSGLQLAELQTQRDQLDETIAELTNLRQRTAESLDAYGESTETVRDIVED